MVPDMRAREPRPDAARNGNGATMSHVEAELIDFFVRLAQLLGLTRSVGEIYGLLFASARPLPMDEFIQRLRISKGSASQGLKLLRSFGAVRAEYMPGDRRDHYVAEVELRKLAAGFLREKVQPQLSWGAERLANLDRLAAQLAGADREILQARLARLNRWRSRGQRMLPTMLKLIRA